MAEATELTLGFPRLRFVPGNARDGVTVGVDVTRGGRGIGTGAADLGKNGGQKKEKQEEASDRAFHTSS